MYRNNDNQLYFRDLNDINSKIMNLQDKYNNYMIENSNDKAYVPVYGSGRSGGMREYPKNYSGGALYNPMNGVAPLNNSWDVDRIKRDRLGGAKFYNVNQPEEVAVAPAAPIELFDPNEPDLPPLPKMKVGIVKKKKKIPAPPAYEAPLPPIGEKSFFEKIGSYFGLGKRKPTKAQIKKIEQVMKSKGYMLGGAWYNEVAKWGKEQLKQQGDNVYAKAGISAIDDLKLGGGKNWWDEEELVQSTRPFDPNRIKDYLGMAKPKHMMALKKHLKMTGSGWNELLNDLKQYDMNRIKAYIGLGKYGKANSKRMMGSGWWDSFTSFFTNTIPKAADSIITPIATGINNAVIDTIGTVRGAVGLGKKKPKVSKGMHYMPDGTLMLDSMHKGKGKAGAGLARSGRAGAGKAGAGKAPSAKQLEARRKFIEMVRAK
jgi:hypothetical protein